MSAVLPQIYTIAATHALGKLQSYLVQAAEKMNDNRPQMPKGTMREVLWPGMGDQFSTDDTNKYTAYMPAEGKPADSTLNKFPAANSTFDIPAEPEFSSFLPATGDSNNFDFQNPSPPEPVVDFSNTADPSSTNFSSQFPPEPVVDFSNTADPSSMDFSNQFPPASVRPQSTDIDFSSWFPTVPSTDSTNPIPPTPTSTDFNPSAPASTSTDFSPYSPAPTSTDFNPSAPASTSTDFSPYSPAPTSTDFNPSAPASTSTDFSPYSPVRPAPKTDFSMPYPPAPTNIDFSPYPSAPSKTDFSPYPPVQPASKTDFSPYPPVQPASKTDFSPYPPVQPASKTDFAMPEPTPTSPYTPAWDGPFSGSDFDQTISPFVQPASSTVHNHYSPAVSNVHNHFTSPLTDPYASLDVPVPTRPDVHNHFTSYIVPDRGVHVKHVPSPVIHDCRSQVADLQLLIDNLRRDNTTLKRGHLDLRNDIQSLLAQIRNLVSDAAEHQRTVVQLQQIIARYKGTGDLRVQLDESRARIARLMTDIQARDSHIHDLEQQLAAERARVSHLTMLLHKFDGVNIDDLHKQLDEAHRVNHEYAQKIEMLIRHIKFFTSQLHKNEPELSELRAQITQLRGEMRTRIEELEKLHLENDKFRQLIHDLTQERDTLREQNGRFAGQLTDMRAHYESELDRLRRELGDLQSRVPSATDMDAMVRIKKHVGELMHEISQLKFTNKHLTENNAQLQQRITALEHQLTELNAAHRLQVEELVRKHDAAVSELEAQIAQGRSERAALEAAIARHEEAMRQLAEQDERHKQDAEHWHALFNRANHDLEEHQRQLQECRAAQNPDELARLGRENAELQRQLQECLTGRADQSENDRLGREVADLQRQLQECLTGRADQSENDRLGREVADLQRQLQECRASQNPDELARLGRENADLQRRLQECLTGRADQSEIDRLGREVTDLQRQLQECRAAQNPDEIDRLSRENTDLQRRLQECLTGRADQSENDRLGREVADLQRRLQECLTGSDQSEIDRLGREIADWKRRYDELKASCKDAAEFARLQHQLEGTVTHLTRLQHEVAGCGEKDRTIAQLRERIRSLEAELLRARPDAAEDPELDRLRALVASLEHRIQVLERELAVALERNRRAVVVNTSVVRQNSSQQEYIRELEADQDTVEIHSRESIPLKELRIKAASMIRNMPPGTKVDMTSDEAYTSENPAKLYSLIEKLWSDHPSTFRPFYDWASQPRWYREIMIGSRLKPSERSEIGKLSDAALADRWMR